MGPVSETNTAAQFHISCENFFMPMIHIFSNVCEGALALNFWIFLLPPSLDEISTEERDIEVKRADLKKHLTLMDVEGKPV